MSRSPILAVLLAACAPLPTLAQPDTRVLETRFTYTATVPAAPPATTSLRLWIPVPSDNALQTITNLQVQAPGPHEVGTEPQHGNRMVSVDLDPGKLPARVVVTFDVARKAAGATGPIQEKVDRERYLKAEALVPITGRYAELGREVAGSKTGAREKMRAIYEHVVATMQYDYKKESPHLGMGDVAFVCDYKKGNCSDLHSYVIALARSQGVPTYLEYGFPLTGIPVPEPVPLTGTIGGYHCWAWFDSSQDGEGWLPVDASDGRRWLDSGRADVKDRLVGNLVLERSAVAFSRGRDVTLVPKQQQPPLNYFIYPYAEADGEEVEATWTVAYELKPPDDLAAQVAQLRQIVIAQAAEIERLKGERTAEKAAGPKAPAGTGTGDVLTFYGQLRADAIHDSDQMSPHAQTPFFVKSPDDASTGGKSNDHLSLHPRLTRLGFVLKAPPDTLPGWALTGRFEMDFQGGGSESRPTPRGRLFFVDLKREAHAVRVGQDWDVISPLMPSPNDDSVMWNAGNLGDRRTQVRYTFDRGTGVNFAVAAAQSGAVDLKDLDANGVRDGEDSGVPMLQTRIGWKGAKAAVGLWGHRAWDETTNPVAGRNDFGSGAVGLDFSVTFNERFDLKGEAWTGSNLSDVRGGVGQGVNTASGERIDAEGGWIELGVNNGPSHRMAFGWCEDDPKDSDLPLGGRGENSARYVHSRWQLGKNFELGANLLHWDTEWLGQRSGTSLRLNTYLSRKF